MSEYVSKWQNEIERALNYKNAVIITGNIRDKYLYKVPHTSKQYKLLDLRNFLSESLKRKYNTVKFYDPLSKIKEDNRTTKSTDSEISGSDVPNSPGPIGGVKSAENELGGRREKSSSEKSQKNSPVDRDLNRIRKELASKDNTCYIIQYADKTMTPKASSEEDMKLVLSLEKMIENMNPNNRLVLIYLSLDQIPDEIHKNHPKSKLIDIPAPERSDLRELFTYYYKIDKDDIESAVNNSDGLKFLETEQIITSLQNGFNIEEYEENIRLYKFGETRNYWDEINLKKINGAFDLFTKHKDYGIKGQDEAIRKLIDIIIKARSDIDRKTGGNPRSPRGRLFLAGPTGVGKTLTAKKLARFLFGSEEALIRFDMSEYKEKFQVTRLYGAPPGFVGYEEGGKLTNAIKEKPFSVVLFDEIEKANPEVFDIFLQILEDGRLTDSKGETVYFSESIILFTSNIGSGSNNTSADTVSQMSSDEIKRRFKESVKSFFTTKIERPELFNRIGENNVVIFNYISDPKTIKEMIRHNLSTVRDEFNKSFENTNPQFSLELHINNLTEFLFTQKEKDINEFGGRIVKDIIDEEIKTRLGRSLLDAEYKNIRSGKIKMGIGKEGIATITEKIS